MSTVCRLSSLFCSEDTHEVPIPPLFPFPFPPPHPLWFNAYTYGLPVGSPIRRGVDDLNWIEVDWIELTYGMGYCISLAGAAMTWGSSFFFFLSFLAACLGLGYSRVHPSFSSWLLLLPCSWGSRTTVGLGGRERSHSITYSTDTVPGQQQRK